MNPTMQYAVEAALQDLVNSPGSLTWHGLETVLARNGLKVEAQDARDNYATGVQALFDEAEQAAVPMRRGRDAPVPAITIDELDVLAEGLTTDG